MNELNERLLDPARRFLTAQKYRFSFTPAEESVLGLFFTNTSERVFFIHSLPEAVVDVLLSMYSRLKNKRGLRGTFVDVFLPSFLASNLNETAEKFGGKPEEFLRLYKVKTLDDFIKHSSETAESFNDFRQAFRIDSGYIERFASSPKVKGFLGMWLDKFGHNSIARMAKLSLCLENISILAAKSLEWTRPGSGYIELSTRYVDMSGKDLYPIEEELFEYGVPKEEVMSVMGRAFDRYRYFQGENFSGPFPEFLRKKYAKLVPDKADLEKGVIGETCDVLGNFLPAATLTSVGVAVSGEAFPDLLRHLILDDTPENMVLAEMIVKEASKIGGDQFSRHFLPTEWKEASWAYLDYWPFYLRGFEGRLQESGIIESLMVPNNIAKNILFQSMTWQDGFSNANDFKDLLDCLNRIPRTGFDKLPNHFEGVSAVFSGVMSFRGWRDLHRQQFATHWRTYLLPYLGFYKYDKSAPKDLKNAFLKTWSENSGLYRSMSSLAIPKELMQYAMALGNLVGFRIGGNLLEMEFCSWQRTKYSVNHEVRQVFMDIEKKLRKEYGWWGKISRADMTPKYAFARTSEGIVLK